MTRIPMWRRYLRLLGDDPAADVREEIEHHLELRAREYEGRGMDAAAAREAAMRRFGDPRAVREACLAESRAGTRSVRRRRWLGSVAQDLRYAARTLRRSPGFAAVAVVTVGLGVGATTAIFSVVDGVLLRPLPYPSAGSLVVPESLDRETGDRWAVTYADFRDWERERVFADVGLIQFRQVNVTGEGDAERVAAVAGTHGFFRALGVTPGAGRALQPADFSEGGPGVAVVSAGLAARRFGSAAGAVGETIRIAGEPVQVVGVLDERLAYPGGSEVWLPLRSTPEERAAWERRDNFIFGAIARLAPGKGLDSTGAELAALASRVEAEDPETRQGVTVTATPLGEYLVGGDLSRSLWLFLAAVGLVLLIGCANVASLLLSRAATRSRELAVRAAVGASRGRLLRQLLVESLLLALLGGALGCALAYAGVAALQAVAPPDVPRLDEVAVDARVLAFALGVSVLAALVFGIVPAHRLSRLPPHLALGEGGRRATGGARGRRVGNALVAAELALSLVLLVGAGLFLRSFANLQRTEPGFGTERLLTFGLSLQGAEYEDDGPRADAYERLLEGIRAAPGVRGAAAVSALPLGGGGFYLGRAFLAEGRPEPPAGEEVDGMWSVASPGYFATMGIPILRGRDFTDRDGADATPVVIVNREFVRRMFPDGEALGRRVRSWRDENVYREIVAVVDDVRFFGAGDEVRPLVYVPHRQNAWGGMAVAVRTVGAPLAALPAVREAVRELDPDLAVSDVRTMAQVLSDSLAPRRFGSLLLAVFAGIALLLALVGVHGVLSHVVTQRTREIGVRMALGAPRSRVLRMVLGDVALVIALGVGAGLAGALALSRAVPRLLYGVDAVDPATFVAVPALLAAVALAAAFRPARRATLVDPTEALRAE